MSMDISTLQSLYSSSGIAGIATNASGVSPSGTAAVSDAYSVDVSQPGQLLSQLQNLAQTDPAQFKQVTANIAQQLQQAASSATGKQAEVLNDLAARFQSASQSGKASDLTPQASQGTAQAGGHHHHHHHAQAAGDAGQSSGSSQSGNDSLWQTIQSIISNALDTATSTG